MKWYFWDYYQLILWAISLLSGQFIVCSHGNHIVEILSTLSLMTINQSIYISQNNINIIFLSMYLLFILNPSSKSQSGLCSLTCFIIKNSVSHGPLDSKHMLTFMLTRNTFSLGKSSILYLRNKKKRYHIFIMPIFRLFNIKIKL